MTSPINEGVNLLPEKHRKHFCTVCGLKPAAWDCHSEDEEMPGAELACNGCLPKIRGLGWAIDPLGDE